jgi:sulfite exporter TauE/SafE
VNEGKMLEEYEKKRKKQVSSMRSILDYAMGTVIMLLGLFFFFRGKFKLAFNESHPPDYLDKILGVIFVIYGAWRLYRGYKKNYF